MQKIILITTMLLALIISSCALPDEPETEIRNIKEIKVVESYYQSPKINDIADDDQFIWCATDDGVVRIDKVTNEKKLYNSKNSPFSSAYGIVIDNNNTVWVNTRYKIYFKLTNSESWQTVEAVNMYVNKIFTDGKNNLWILSYNNLYKYVNNTCQQLDTTGSVRLVTIDRNDNLWYCTSDSLNHLKKFDGNQITNYQLPDTLKKTYITSIAVNNNLEIAIGTYNRGIAIFDQTNWQIFNSNNSSLPNGPANQIGSDYSNNFWFLTSFQTIIKLSPSGEITNYNPTNAPVKNIGINLLRCDRNGRMLFGAYECSDTKNLLIYSSNSWWKSSCLLYPQPTSINDMLTDKDSNVWLAGKNGITKINNGNWQFYIPDTEDTTNQVDGLEDVSSMIEDNNGNIWFATDGGVIKYNGREFLNFTHLNTNLPNETVKALSIDQQNNLMVGFSSGIYKYDGNNFSLVQTCSFSTMWAIGIDHRDYIWVQSTYAQFYSGYWWRYDLSVSPLSKITYMISDKNKYPWFVTQKDGHDFVYKRSYNGWYNYDWNNMGFSGIETINTYNPYILKTDRFDRIIVFNHKYLSVNDNDNWQPYLFSQTIDYCPTDLDFGNGKDVWLISNNRLFKAEVQE